MWGHYIPQDTDGAKKTMNQSQFSACTHEVFKK